MVLSNKKIKNATPLDYNGIHFKSKLEVVLFKVLEENNLNPQYEPVTFVLIDGWKPVVPFYRRDKKTKQLIKEEKKVISVKYTPDIIFKWGEYTVFIEAKGMENDVYYLKKKLFRRLLENSYLSDCFPVFAEIKTKREMIDFLEILKKNYKNEEV